jgi:hypothetical protein
MRPESIKETHKGEAVLLLNFTHPLTTEQERWIEAVAGRKIERTIAVMPQFEEEGPFTAQTEALLDGAGLSPEEWQTTPMIVNLPGFAPAAALLLAGLHGRMGYFPTIVRLRPVKGILPRVFAVAELIDLQGARDTSRIARQA